MRALEFVKADGSVMTLHRDKDGERFQNAVVHLGALGVVTRVTTLDILPRFDMSQTVYTNLSFDQLEHNLEVIMASGYSVSLFTDWQKNRVNQVWIKDVATTPKQMPPVFYGAALQTRRRCHRYHHPGTVCTVQMGTIGPWYLRLPHFNWSSHLPAARRSKRIFRRQRYKAVRWSSSEG